MRKHFLILFLLTLLPFTAWAAKTNISDYTVTLENLDLTYNGAHQNLPAVTKIAKGDDEVADFTTNWEISWTYAGAAFNPTGTAITNAGNYTVTITATAANANYTGSVSKVYTVAKFGTLTVTAKNPSMVYGGAQPTLADFYEIVDNAVYTKFQTDGGVAALGAPVSMPTIDVVNAGSRNFTLVAREYTNYDVSVTQPNGTLTIAQKAITVTANNLTAITYGAAKPTPTVADYSAGLVGDDQLEGTLTFDFKKVVAAEEVLVEAAILPAGTYHVYPKGLSNDNYAIDYAYGTLVVNQKALSPSMIAAMTTVTYNGQNQAPTLTVTDGNLPALVADVDYTAAWTSSVDGAIANPAADNVFKKAATYTVTLSGTGDGNYKTPTGTQPAATKTYIIDKKELYIKTKNVVKTYDGLTPYAPAANAAHLTFVGLETGDAANYAGLVVELGESATAGLTKGVDAGDYPINITISTDNTTGFAAANPLAVNYTPNPGSIGKLTINKKAITITPNPISKKYGEVDSYVDGVVATGIATSATDLAAGKIQVTGTFVNYESITTLPTLTREEGEAAGTLALTAAGAVIKNSLNTGSTDDDVDVTKNYAITYNPSTFTITKGGFTIWADDKTSVFGQEIVELSCTVDGIPAADAAKIVFNEGYITTEATAASNRGVYTITIDKNKIDFSAIEDLYDITKVVVVPGNYTITPKALKIKAKDQAHLLGQGVSDAVLENIQFVTEGVSATDKAAVIANIKLSFSGANGLSTYLSGDPATLQDGAQSHGYNGTAATTNGIWVGAIVIDPTDYNDLTTANYTLNPAVATGAGVEAGTLYVTAANTPVTFDNMATATTQITNVAGKIVNATISTGADDDHTRTLYANAWNALVLPFDITPRAFCVATGSYAVFDVLQAGQDAANFKITISEIPAYTPFLVKVDQEIDLSTKTFEGVLIKAIDEAALTQSTSEAGNMKFVGTVKQASIPAPSWTIYPNEDTGAIQLNPHKAAKTIKAFTAYFTTIDGTNPINAPQVFIEEPDGSTTAISTINAEGVAMKADGWYTINGVKLQSIPTEKGVYINNGKKVVIK